MVRNPAKVVPESPTEVDQKPTEAMQRLEREKEQQSISEVVEELVISLNRLDAEHPYLIRDYPEYAALSAGIRDFKNTTENGMNTLGFIFDELRKCLHTISDERNSRLSHHGLRSRLIPRRFLPMSFDLLRGSIHERKNVAMNIREALADAVEDVISGEIGINEIPEAYRNKVKGMVLQALVFDYGRASQIRAQLGEAGGVVFDLLRKPDNKLKELRSEAGVNPSPIRNPENSEQIEAAVALIIMRTRGQISHGQPL